MQVQGLSLHSAVHSTYIYSHESKPNFAYGLRLSCLPKRVSKSTSVFGNRGRLVSVRCVMAAERKDSDCDDGFYMKRCVEIARKAIGCTSPNPMVGCLIVKDGKVVGEGFHPKAGQPHAEVFALRSCGDLAENATAYVSLEPCNHYGRTPPCTEALIKAKVKRVVVGMVDPNPIVSSKGVDRLRQAGIEVTVGVEEEICKRLNESYIHQIVTGNPFVTLRYSISVNGKIVDQIGEGAADPGGYYSKLLQEYDAVIVSSAAIADNFVGSSSREPGANQPLWIVVSSNDNSSSIKVPDLKSEADSKLIMFCDQETRVEPELAENGVETVVLDKMNLGAVLEYCKRQGFCSVLLDLRGDRSDENNLLQQGFAQNLVRKIVVEILPIWAESHGERTAAALENMAKTIALKRLQPKIMGKSVLLEGYF